MNDPCHAFGYKVHQAAWFNDLAHLRITNADGRVVVDQNLDFNSENTAVPTIKVTVPSGATLFDAEIPQMGTDPGETDAREDDYATADLAFPSEPNATTGPLYQIAWRVVRETMELTLTGPDLEPVTIRPGESVLAGTYRIAFVGARSIPAIQVFDMPGATTPAGATVQMPEGPNGTPYLYLVGIDSEPTLLATNRPVSVGGFTYTFQGRVEASGLSIKRDPGDALTRARR